MRHFLQDLGDFGDFGENSPRFGRFGIPPLINGRKSLIFAGTNEIVLYCENFVIPSLVIAGFDCKNKFKQLCVNSLRGRYQRKFQISGLSTLFNYKSTNVLKSKVLLQNFQSLF